jgi:hypothetical protein
VSIRIARWCTFIPKIRIARWYIFIPKNPNWGIFWRALELKKMEYFMANWIILRSFGIFENFVVIWYTFFPVWVYLSRKIWHRCQSYD